MKYAFFYRMSGLLGLIFFLSIGAHLAQAKIRTGSFSGTARFTDGKKTGDVEVYITEVNVGAETADLQKSDELRTYYGLIIYEREINIRKPLQSGDLIRYQYGKVVDYHYGALFRITELPSDGTLVWTQIYQKNQNFLGAVTDQATLEGHWEKDSDGSKLTLAPASPQSICSGYLNSIVVRSNTSDPDVWIPTPDWKNESAENRSDLDPIKFSAGDGSRGSGGTYRPETASTPATFKGNINFDVEKVDSRSFEMISGTSQYFSIRKLMLDSYSVDGLGMEEEIVGVGVFLRDKDDVDDAADNLKDDPTDIESVEDNDDYRLIFLRLPEGSLECMYQAAFLED